MLEFLMAFFGSIIGSILGICGAELLIKLEDYLSKRKSLNNVPQNGRINIMDPHAGKIKMPFAKPSGKRTPKINDDDAGWRKENEDNLF